MESIFTIKSDNDKRVVRKLNKGLHVDSIKEKNHKLNFDIAEGENREIFIDGIKINIRNEKLYKPLVINVEHNFPFLKIHFEIEGFSRYTPKNDKSIPVIIENGCYNFFYLPKVKGVLDYPTFKRKSLEIIFTEDCLKRIFKRNFREISSSFGKALETQEPFIMFTKSQPIPPNLLLIITDIINCSYDKEIKQVYLESKVIEIFSFLFNQIKEKETLKKTIKINKLEREQILKAEAFLQENFRRPPTIKKLSEEVGINQHKLKKQFKLIFKEPIFSYITTLRMEKAKKMLIEDELTVSEVAYKVGYKNPQHFTFAFKKRFDYLPSHLKKKYC